MRFDLRANSPDMITPVHQFPGDEAISPALYRSVIYGGYVTTTATLYGAARAIGLEVDPEAFERWKRIGAAAGLLDDFLDESPDPLLSQQLYDQGLANQIHDSRPVHLPSGGDERLIPAVNMMLASVSNVPELRKERLINAARSIGRIALTKAAAEDLETYTDILKQEAIDSSNLVRYSASGAMLDQPEFDVFADWCDQAIALGTLYDHARDLPVDSKLGRTLVEPSLKNQLRLGAQAAIPFGRLMKTHTSRRASRAAIAARMRYSPLPTKRLFTRISRQ